LLGRDRVEIGSTGEVHGDISTLRISIGEGAQIHSRVEIDRPNNSQNNRLQQKSSAAPPAVEQAAAMKAGGDNGN